MLQRINNFFRKSQKGQGIVEYALILAFVVAIATVALSPDSGIGEAIQKLFSDTSDKISGSSNTGGSTTGGTTGGGSESTGG